MASMPSLTVPVVIQLELTHAAPIDGQATTRCCNHSPFELKRPDRMTTDLALVTCPGAWLTAKQWD